MRRHKIATRIALRAGAGAEKLTKADRRLIRAFLRDDDLVNAFVVENIEPVFAENEDGLIGLIRTIIEAFLADPEKFIEWIKQLIDLFSGFSGLDNADQAPPVSTFENPSNRVVDELFSREGAPDVLLRLGRIVLQAFLDDPSKFLGLLQRWRDDPEDMLIRTLLCVLGSEPD